MFFQRLFAHVIDSIASCLIAAPICLLARWLFGPSPAIDWLVASSVTFAYFAVGNGALGPSHSMNWKAKASR